MILFMAVVGNEITAFASPETVYVLRRRIRRGLIPGLSQAYLARLETFFPLESVTEGH